MKTGMLLVFFVAAIFLQQNAAVYGFNQNAKSVIKRMIIPKKFFHACDPSYQIIISKLEDEIARIEAEKFPIVQIDDESDEGNDMESDDDEGNDDEMNDDVGSDFGIDDGESDENEDGNNDYKKEIRKLIFKYGKISMLPKEYWDYCINRISGYILDFDNKNHSDTYNEIISEAKNHFIFNTQTAEFLGRKGTKKRLLDFTGKVNCGFGHYKITEEDLSYPHSHLFGCFQYFESHSLIPPSNEICTKYAKMKELYSKIKSAENDNEKWVNLLAETNDHKFIVDNVEYCLGKNLLDKSLWKCYISYLSQSDELVKEMLEILSRYCRFFMDDLEMKEQYKNKLEKYGKSINLQWKNLFDFEIGFVEDVENDENKSEEKIEKMDVDEKPMAKNTHEMEPLDPNLCKNFFNNFAPQNLHFRSTVISYIFANAKPAMLQKLQKCCKYFYAKKNIPLCYLLKATSCSTKFQQQSLSLKYKQKRENVLKQTFIFGSIIAKTDGFYFIPSNFISSCIPHLYRCTAKHIVLEKQNLTFAELKFLIGSGNVVQFKMSGGKIINENGEFLQLEQIMELLPNIETLSLSSVVVNKDTPTALSTLTFFKKLSRFAIYPIFGEPFDPNEFLNFCIKLRDPENFSLSFTFHHHIFNDEFVNNFKKIMEGYKNKCKNNETEIQVFVTNDAMLEAQQ